MSLLHRKTNYRTLTSTPYLQKLEIPCFSANALALSSLRAEQATTDWDGKCFNACVKSWDTRPHPINPHFKGGHSKGSLTDGSSRGLGGTEVAIVTLLVQFWSFKQETVQDVPCVGCLFCCWWMRWDCRHHFFDSMDQSNFRSSVDRCSYVTSIEISSINWCTQSPKHQLTTRRRNINRKLSVRVGAEASDDTVNVKICTNPLNWHWYSRRRNKTENQNECTTISLSFRIDGHRINLCLVASFQDWKSTWPELVFFAIEAIGSGLLCAKNHPGTCFCRFRESRLCQYSPVALLLLWFTRLPELILDWPRKSSLLWHQNRPHQKVNGLMILVIPMDPNLEQLLWTVDRW